ncbi:hypothetical protein Taro_003765 [Colocasia esculenta]|uniref:Uncharacterized protein n=1 Tax=Colocasia esculenta TaxID=4460 RepID=A0A843TMM0_COLES|nr:hypothetical protein [Colocasia esculenta]
MFCRCVASLHDSCACCRLQLLLCHVRGECGRSACSCCSGAVGAGLASSGLPCVEDACEPVQVRCSWSSSAHLSVCVSRRLREPACCVAFTDAGLLPVEPVEGSECVAATVGGACCERGCCFARVAVGFVLGLHVRVGVSRRLREPTCGVAFTGAGLWSTEPVEGVLALLAAPFSLGSSSLLVLVEVRLPQNCVMLVSGCCGVALWVEWDFVCPQDREVGFVSRALWALPDGGLLCVG